MAESKYKVLLVNGSPQLKGCVARAFDELEKTLNECGVDTERISIGNKDIRGCIACMYCRTHGKCVFNDAVNETAPKFAEADGMIVGTPVYYAGPNGQLHSFMDRLFFSTGGVVDTNQKVGATVVSSRRAGSVATFDSLNHFSLWHQCRLSRQHIGTRFTDSLPKMLTMTSKVFKPCAISDATPPSSSRQSAPKKRKTVSPNRRKPFSQTSILKYVNNIHLKY